MNDFSPLVFAAALLMALAIDHYFGEPPARWHPVVWMGNYLNWAAPQVLPARRISSNARNLRAVSLGVTYWWVGTAIVLIASCILQWSFMQLPVLLAALALGVSLHKPGVYALNATGRPPQALDTVLAQQHASKALVAAVLWAQEAIILIAMVEFI